jgi:hypothetical protein
VSEILNEDKRKILSTHFDDRVPLYLTKMLKQKPMDYFKQVRNYWILGIILNIVFLFLISGSIYYVLSKNSSSSLYFTRIDGLHVVEEKDIRRDVLLENSLKRARIKMVNNLD